MKLEIEIRPEEVEELCFYLKSFAGRPDQESRFDYFDREAEAGEIEKKCAKGTLVFFGPHQSFLDVAAVRAFFQAHGAKVTTLRDVNGTNNASWALHLNISANKCEALLGVS